MCEKAILVCFDFSLRLKTDEGSVIDPTQQGLLALAPGLADSIIQTQRDNLRAETVIRHD